MYSPKLVPKFFGYANFIRTMVLILACTVFFMPLIRDFFSQTFITNNEWVPYLNLVFIYSFNPKLFSPFVNYVLNSKISRENRTTINSISFISSTLSASIILNIFTALYAESFGSEFFLRFQPYNKYVPFGLLSLLLVLGISFLRKIKPEEVKKIKSEEDKKTWINFLIICFCFF